ncbi:hypothetical protein [Fluviispira sanaruensis]|uniref:Uncharacterized protein n=1 Tax=Fluviispira sanaruensis TaxID=2493639 RepID=A0A4P2VMS2_FLUSA|nr:hypothetical protein [Fluviispira sanaruensis]BBH54716.1 hypothetical protein JCM31447_31900 [Fluviispira sanaruensis]
MSLDVSGIAPLMKMGTMMTGLGIVCFLSYNFCTGTYRKENLINIIKYLFAFGAGYFILKSFIDSNHVISFTSTKIVKYANVTVVGVWAFSFDTIASAAQNISTFISVQSAGAATASIAIIFAGIALHSRLAMNAWRGTAEVFESFIFGTIAFLCLAYFDVIYECMSLFLDAMVSSLFDYNIYERYSISLNPILDANRNLVKNISSFNILGSFSNMISMALGGITLMLLFVMDLVNLLLYMMQYFGLLLLPTFTIMMSFFSGIDPTKPLKLCGAFACMSLLAKTQIIVMNLLFSSFSSTEAGAVGEAVSQLDLGIALAGDNLTLIFKVTISIICSLVMIFLVSTKVLVAVFNIVATSQMAPMIGQTRALINNIRR